MQRHLGADMLQGLHLEMGVAHPALESAKGMLNGFPPLAHLPGMFVQPALHFFENIFAFPTGDPALLACGALILDSAVRTNVGPVAVQD